MVYTKGDGDGPKRKLQSYGGMIYKILILSEIFNLQFVLDFFRFLRTFGL